MKLYLAHPTLSRKEIRKWELEIEQKFNIELSNPFYDVYSEEVYLMDNNLRNPFDYNIDSDEIVETDLCMIDEANGLLGVIDENVAVGLFMEVLYAKQNYKPVIIICPNTKLLHHPWLQYCADIIFDSFEQFEAYWSNRDCTEKTILLGICGKKRSGKDTVAKYLVDKHNFKQFAFADEIKMVDKRVFGTSNEEIDKKNYPVRNRLQLIGDKIREINEDVWLNLTLKRIENYRYILPREYNKVIISDVRLIREAETLKNNGYTIWKIIRNEIDDLDMHRTETEVEKILSDMLFFNNFSIDKLLESVERGLRKE